ncbi:MAG: RNA polymerase sigma factor [Bryobacteraceae bacterium]
MAGTTAAGTTEIAAVPVSATASFTQWMAAEQRRVYLLCLRMLRNPEDADSAAQDTFLKAYRAIEKQEADLADRSRWLTRIAVNTCLDVLRSRRWQFWRQRPSQEDERALLEVAPAPGPTAEQAAFAQQIGRRISEALARLSGRQRAVFVLRHYEDRSLEEIGDLLGLEVGTVKAHMSRALVKLRIELQDLYGKQSLER